MFDFLDLPSFIQAVGLIGLWFIIFAESGLLFGFFLPGDSLLFTAGFLASQGYLDIWLLVLACFSAAVLGDNIGYAFGRRAGQQIFKRKDSIVFNEENLVKTQQFYEKYGGKTIVLARFIPVIRTLAPILAGVGKMRYKAFFSNNIVGAMLWAAGIPLLGYWLGNAVPEADRYVLTIVGLIIFFSALPQIILILRNKKRRIQLIGLIKRKFGINPADPK